MSLTARVAGTLQHWNERLTRSRTDELDQCVAARAASAQTRSDDPVRPPLDDVVRQAWTIGQSIDLSHIGYGPAHWKIGERFSELPFPYYGFLSGLVRSEHCKRIFEVGTHYGGSILSMLRGIADPEDAEIVTVDVTDLNPALHGLPRITKIVGDANTEGVIQKTIILFGNEPIDLFYIDADHRFLPTLTSLSLYSTLLRPRLVVVDDIALTDGMRAMWNVVRVAHGAEAINCVDVIPEIRSSVCGFGLLRLR